MAGGLQLLLTLLLTFPVGVDFQFPSDSDLQFPVGVDFQLLFPSASERCFPPNERKVKA